MASLTHPNMSNALALSDTIIDCFGIQYQRDIIRGNGFCGYNSISYCLTGTEENYGHIIEDCINVFTNFPDLLHQRTNFGATNQSREAVARYQFLMRNAIQRIQSGDALTSSDDEVLWLSLIHI